MTSYFAKVTKSQVNIGCLKCQRNTFHLTCTFEFLYHNTDGENQPIDITVNTRGSPCHQLHYQGTHPCLASQVSSSLVDELLKDKTLLEPQVEEKSSSKGKSPEQTSAPKEGEIAKTKAKKTKVVESAKSSNKKESSGKEKLPKKRVYAETVEANPENAAGGQRGANPESAAGEQNVESDSKKRRKTE